MVKFPFHYNDAKLLGFSTMTKPIEVLFLGVGAALPMAGQTNTCYSCSESKIKRRDLQK